MSALRTSLAVIAGLMGALGVAFAAAAAHSGAERLAPAAQMLLVHAAATLALLALVRPSWLRTLSVVGLEFGSALFAADMAARTWGSGALFPMAAPIGGTIIILAWLVAAIACVSLARD